MTTTLYVGDVHGCGPELEELLGRVGPDRVVLLGDLFTRGPDPVRVWDQIHQSNLTCIMGNHDARMLRQLRAGAPLEGALAALEPHRAALQGFLEGLPTFRVEPGRVAVHAGLHPLLGVAGTPERMAQNLRRWPDDSDPGNPFWYDAGWAGPELVLFGHDAVRGLVRRERAGRPVAIGLDSGCVYGGRLSGWIAERDEVVQVPARGVWYSWA